MCACDALQKVLGHQQMFHMKCFEFAKKFPVMHCSMCVSVCQELECLQDHLEDLVSNCRDVVGNLTELESEVKKNSNAFVIFTAV